MKLRKISLVLLLISSVSLADVSRRPIPRQRGEHQLRPQKKIIQNNTVELDLSYDFFVPGETFRISFIVLLPKTIPGRQKILSIKYSPKPSRFFHENGNRYAEFIFIKPDIFRDRAFGRMRPVYIYLSYVRNDEIINNYHFARYTYRGDRAIFKDSIEFKQPSSPFRKTP